MPRPDRRDTPPPPVLALLRPKDRGGKGGVLRLNPAHLAYALGVVTEQMIDRCEAAVEAGVIELLADDDSPGEVTTLAFTVRELALLYSILAPLLFPPDRPDGTPAASPPGSAERAEDYARRESRGLKLFNADDADPVKDDRRGLKIVPAKGGGGRVQADGTREQTPPVVTGWADDRRRDAA